MTATRRWLRTMTTTSAPWCKLKFQIGKHALEPLWWLNPMDFSYKKLTDMNPDKIAKDIMKDSDDDGVPDKLDREPNTKKGCPVDAHGVILDSDKDGIPDCDDKEPFSPPGYPIDQNGVAIIPPNPCCNVDTSDDAWAAAKMANTKDQADPNTTALRWKCRVYSLTRINTT
ncbi:unnamed protein product, partial [Sphagnum balticum]